MEATWFWMAPVGSVGSGAACGEGKEETTWSERWFPPLFSPFPGLQASTIQNPVTAYAGKDSSSYLRVTFSKTTDPIMEMTSSLNPQRLGLCPAESSYKLPLNWMSGRLFPSGIAPTTEFTASYPHPHIPLGPQRPPPPTPPQYPSESIFQEKWNNGLKYTPLPPAPLLQIGLHANEADRMKILCKATNEQMIRGNLQSSALHIYAYSTPAHFIANRLYNRL